MIHAAGRSDVVKAKCCVCGDKAEGLIVYGEFVCFTCHEEATGERPEPKTFEGKLHGASKRHSMRDALIAERFKNIERERC